MLARINIKKKLGRLCHKENSGINNSIICSFCFTELYLRDLAIIEDAKISKAHLVIGNPIGKGRLFRSSTVMLDRLGFGC